LSCEIPRYDFARRFASPFFIAATHKPLQWAALSRAYLMPMNHSSDDITDLERRILRALCRLEISPLNWNRLAASLSEYSWREPDHRVVYDALRGIRSRDATTRRDQLPAQVTRMGFPDVDWSLYFGAEEMPDREIEELIRQLKAETAGRS
jgi:hypothetical protein